LLPVFGEFYSVVWSTTPSEFDRVKGLSEVDFVAELNAKMMPGPVLPPDLFDKDFTDRLPAPLRGVTVGVSELMKMSLSGMSLVNVNEMGGAGSFVPTPEVLEVCSPRVGFDLKMQVRRTEARRKRCGRRRADQSERRAVRRRTRREGQAGLNALRRARRRELIARRCSLIARRCSLIARRCSLIARRCSLIAPMLAHRLPSLAHRAPMLAHRLPSLAHRAPMLAHRLPSLAHRAPMLVHRSPPLLISRRP